MLGLCYDILGLGLGSGYVTLGSARQCYVRLGGVMLGLGIGLGLGLCVGLG